MLLLALLLAQVASPPPEAIVVIGKRLATLRFSAKVDKRGQVRCRIMKSSGDPAVDAIGCAAVYDCAPRKLRAAKEIEACMGERLAARSAALAEAVKN